MKLHRPVINAITESLQQIFADGYYADKVLERQFRNHRQWGARDRRLIAESVYEIVRWWRYLWFCLNEEPSTSVDALMRLFGAWRILQNSEIPDWPEFKGLTAESIKKFSQEARLIPAVRESVPDWLYETGRAQLGEKWDSILHELNQQAPVILRANRLKTSPERLIASLAEDGFEAQKVPTLPDAVILSERKNVFTSKVFQAGHFEVQDGASQQVAPLLQPEPGQRVIDACAGAGGKTLHLGALMKNKGRIVAMDISERKLEELRKRTRRAGVDIVDVKVIESTKTIKRMADSADRLLLDVPCSGTGVLRRNPDTKWKLAQEELTRLNAIQREILESYGRMVKPGGLMVYATCSILPSENEDQAKWFSDKFADSWELLREIRFDPGTDGFDGFYAAVFRRQG